MIQNETNETDIFLRGTIAQELDFYRITETVSQLAASEEGRALLKQREAVSDKEQITKLKSLGREWSIYLNSTRPAAIHGWPSVGTVFPLLGIDGAQLSQEQLFTLALFCTAAQTAKTLIESAAEEFEIPNLNSIAQEMPSLKEAGDMIFSVLDKDGNVRDLPELRTIRAKIASLHKEIESSIRKYTSDPALNGALQSNVPAFRADRELLAVRADHRSAVSGIVHEVSASGQTIYVEPEEVVRANNELIQQEFALQSELRRIFRELTAKIGIFKDDFTDTLSKMTLLDTTCAAAKWQSSTRGVFAEDCDMQKEPPAIYKARHPLLGDKAVPVDISFMDSKRVLIITGPNTGGKTVTLKTIGLFALLNQAGLPVPAAEGTRLPVFSSIFADIGDEQSIDDSLSTFSSHMKKTAQMVNCADINSLILLDELASGTDPQEGGAIAMATLDTLIERGSFTIVTTHHGILKNYGYTNKSCINASVEFDTGTLAPTYRLLMGVPGESHAIDIALKSGLPQSVVNKAREYISTEQADVSTLIRGLTQKHAELDSLLKTQKEKEQKLAVKELKIQEKEVSLKEQEIELRQKEKKSASEFVSQTRKQLENLVRELREGEITREKTLAVKSFISGMSDGLDAISTDIQNTKDSLKKQQEEVKKQNETLLQNGIRLGKQRSGGSSSNKKTRQKMSNAEALKTASVTTFSAGAIIQEPPKPVSLLPGTEVIAGTTARRGVLLKKEKSGNWSVQFGSMKMSVPESAIKPLVNTPTPSFSTPQIVFDKAQDSSEESERPKFELRLLGMRYEEAVKALEKQLDLCAIHNFKSFSVIHGKGSGILQQAVRDILSHYPGIKEFHFAMPEEGGTGKTYVTLM